MPADSWKLAPGLHNVGSYQVSGRPWASGSIDGKHGLRLGGHEIIFPYVTRWFEVINKDTSNNCKVAFSVSGMTGACSNYFTVQKADVADGHGLGSSGILELKVSSIWVSGSTDVDIVAGLTGVPAQRTTTLSGTAYGPRDSIPRGFGTSWSGSTGVG